LRNPDYQHDGAQRDSTQAQPLRNVHRLFFFHRQLDRADLRGCRVLGEAEAAGEKPARPKTIRTMPVMRDAFM
jgi:hypothetical protein